MKKARMKNCWMKKARINTATSGVALCGLPVWLMAVCLCAGKAVCQETANPSFATRSIATTPSASSSVTSSSTPFVMTEEVITRFAAANNGADPLWAYASPNIVREGNDVYVSIIETGQDVPPLCNTRWQVWKRGGNQWYVIVTETGYRQREPCPLVNLGDGQLLLSANPSVTKPGTRYRACVPAIYFISDRDRLFAEQETPQWSGVTNFIDHSYRGIATDATLRDTLLLNIDTKTSEQHVSYRDATGRWQSRGKIGFPIRAAYPQVGIRNHAAHVLAIGDIREPKAEWQTLKREVLKREWDYVFRRLFYTQTSDIRRFEFAPPVEIDSVEQTGGHILNLDMHIDPRGTVHLLYLKKPHQHAFLRDKYFPNARMESLLEYVVLDRGRLVHRATLARTPDKAGLDPSYARFHIAPGEAPHTEAIYVVIAGKQKQPGEPDKIVNVIQGIRPPREPRVLPLKHPFQRLFTSTPRGGSQASNIIDLYGTADDVPSLRYAAIQLRAK